MGISYKSFVNQDDDYKKWEEERTRERNEAGKKLAEHEAQRKAFNENIIKPQNAKAQTASPSIPKTNFNTTQYNNPGGNDYSYDIASKVMNKFSINKPPNIMPTPKMNTMPMPSINNEYTNNLSYNIALPKAQGLLRNFQNPQAIANEPSWGTVASNATKSALVGSADGMLNMARVTAHAVDNKLDNKDGAFIKWLDNNHEYLNNKVQGYEKNLENVSPYSNKDFLNQGIKGAVQVGTMFLPGVAVSKGAKAVGLGAKAVDAARMLPFGLQAGGNYASDAEKQGATENQQLAYGLVGGGAEIASESFFGVGPLTKKYGKEVAEKLINKGATDFLGKYGKLGLSYAKNILGETAQEVIIDPVMGTAEKAIYNPNKSWTGENGVFDRSQMGQDAFGGAAMSVMLAALGLGVNTVSHRKASYLIENNIKPTPEIVEDIQNTMSEEMPNLQTSQAQEVNQDSEVANDGIQNPNAVKPTLNNQNTNIPSINTSTVNNQPNNVPAVNPSIKQNSLNNAPDTNTSNNKVNLASYGNVEVLSNDGTNVMIKTSNGETMPMSKQIFDILSTPLENTSQTSQPYNKILKPTMNPVNKNSQSSSMARNKPVTNEIEQGNINTPVENNLAEKPFNNDANNIKEDMSKTSSGLSLEEYRKLADGINKDLNSNRRNEEYIKSKYQGLIDLGLLNKYSDGYYFNYGEGFGILSKNNPLPQSNLEASSTNVNVQSNVNTPIENKTAINQSNEEIKPIENKVTTLEAPKSIEPGQKYKTSFGEVTVKDNDGSMVKLVNKSGTEIPIGTKAFSNLKPIFLGEDNSVVRNNETTENNDEIIDDNTPTEDLDNPIEMYKAENQIENIVNKPSLEPSVLDKNTQGNVVNPVEEKVAEKANLEEAKEDTTSKETSITERGNAEKTDSKEQQEEVKEDKKEESPENKHIVDTSQMINKPQEDEKEVKEEAKAPENILSTISKLNDDFRKGNPLDLEYVKTQAEYIMENEDIIKAELSKLKNAELDKMMNPWSRSQYPKKDSKVKHIYNNQLNRLYYDISGSNSLSGLTFGGRSIEEQMKDKIKGLLENLTQEKLDKILEENKKSFNEAAAERKARLEGIMNPTTLKEFEDAIKYRKKPLTAEEQRQYEELKALKEKDKAEVKKEVKVEALNEIIEDAGFTELEKSKNTKTDETIWNFKLTKQVEKDQWKEILQQVKKLGGSYWKGNFYFIGEEKPTELFETLKNGGKVTKEESKPNKEKNVADKLREVADNMQKTIDDKFADRLTNTARRANMAASAEKEGETLKKEQQIIRNIANLIESGEAVHLDGVSARTHIETLEGILRRTKNNYADKLALEKYPRKNNNDGDYLDRNNYEKELKRNAETEFNSIDTAEMPLNQTYIETLRQLVKETINIQGTARTRQRIDKAIVQNKSKDNPNYINTKNIVDDIIDLYDKLKKSGKDFNRDSDILDYKRLQTMGIKNTTMLRTALREFHKAKGNFELSPEEIQAKKVKEIERSLIGQKFESYFPTPKKIVSRMLEEADIQDGDKILEPSAGTGHIADMIKEEFPNNNLEVGEYNTTLSSLLKEKGHNVVSDDFLEHSGKYDKIIMNPPFEKNQDVIHVQHAYDLLNPGGRIVAIMSEHPFFANDKKSVEFREWLDNLGGVSEKLPDGAFKESDRSTGVSTRIVIIDKSENNKNKSKNTKAYMGTAAAIKNNVSIINSTEKPLPRKQIIDSLIKSLDIPARIGRINSKGALGIYKENQEVIRTKISEDAPILSHEIGHHLTKLFKLDTLVNKYKDYKKEIMNLGEEQAKLQKLDTEGQINEGISEFIRLYLTGEDVNQYRFTSMFEKMLTKDIRQALQTFRTEYTKYLNASPGDKIISQVSFGNSRKTIKEKAKEKVEEAKTTGFSKFYTTWIDELRPIYDFVKQGKVKDISSNPYKMAWLFRGWSGKAIGAIKGGVYNYNSEGKLIKVSEGLNEILKPIAEKDMDKFRQYIISKRVIEKEAQGIRTGFNLTDAKSIVSQVEEFDNNREFIKAHEQLQTYQDAILRRLVDGGLMSEEQYKKIKELNKDYVPFYRALSLEENGGKYTGETFGNIKSPVKKMKGGNASIIDPIESMVKNTYYFTNLAERNLVAQSLVKFSEENEGMGKYVENVTPKFQGSTFELKEIKKSLEDAGVDLKNADLEQIATVFRPIVKGNATENIVTVTFNGKAKLYQIEPDLYRSIMGLDKESSNLIFRIMNTATKTLRAGAVLNPDFAARNIARDTLGAFIYSKYHFIPILDNIKGLYHVLKQDEIYNLWMNSGAAQSEFVSMDRDYLSKGVREVMSKGKPLDLVKEFLVNPLAPLQYLSSISEESTRVGYFNKGYKKEGNSKEGLAEVGISTRDLTLDFSRSGTAGKNANKVIAFFNATLQGQDKTIRALKNPETRIPTLIKTIIGITLPSIALWMKYHDDEKIKELPAWRKNLYWNIPTENYVISIPKPFELGIIFGSLVERTLDFAYDNDKKAMKGWSKEFLGNILPGVMPTVLGPAIETAFNYSAFRGTNIETQTDKNLPAYERYSSSTSLTAKKLGEAATKLPFMEEGISPKKIDNLVQGYTAGLGKQTVEIIDKLLGSEYVKPSSTLKQIPGVRGFLAEPFTQSRTVEDFYEDKTNVTKEYTNAVRKYKAEHPEMDEKEWNKKLRNNNLPLELSNLHKQKKVYDDIGDYLSGKRDEQQEIYNNNNLSANVKQGKINKLNHDIIQHLKEKQSKFKK